MTFGRRCWRAKTRQHAAKKQLQGERGMVTAELAAALPALALVVVLSVWCLSLVAVQLRCTDAAREAARAAARGEQTAVVREIATGVAPGEATVRVDSGRRSSSARELVTVEVRVTVDAPPPLGAFGEATVVGRASALREVP